MMTREEALEMIKDAPRSDNKESNINPVLTEAQAFNLINGYLTKDLKEGDKLPLIMARRVFQVSQNVNLPEGWFEYRRREYYDKTGQLSKDKKGGEEDVD